MFLTDACHAREALTQSPFILRIICAPVVSAHHEGLSVIYPGPSYHNTRLVL